MPMPSCSICLEPFTSPVSLPCGHVFCKECIRRTVEATKSWNAQQFCPTCRAPYGIPTVDPALIPPFLRPHILPPIRKVFLSMGDPETPVASTSANAAPVSSPAADLARANAEINALRMHCAAWRRRAEVHAAANHTLLTFTRTAKDCALRMRAERDTERTRCVLLKRKLAEVMPELDLDCSESSFTKQRKHTSEKGKQAAACVAKPCPSLPVFLLQCKRAEYEGTEQRPSLLGPPMKRRKCEDDSSAASSPTSIPDSPAPHPPTTPLSDSAES
ncbi:hypothetical protein MVEN_02505700 [Mycena venus]|uniref:RING-type domain-containing protein n=1 Tax=Mycena venus TaxID=2733690 RepID=A0A8H6U311_9AGAR|nr:hypothetical protein MVEN_02505700 [Mycena venus]